MLVIFSCSNVINDIILRQTAVARVVRLAPAAFRFHAHLGRPPLSTLGLRSPSAIAASCLSIPRAPMQTPRLLMRRPSS